MPFKLRILNAANRTMQRAGFLKLLCAAAARSDTSSLQTLGNHLIETVTKRIRVEPPFSDALKTYANLRLTDRIYADLRKNILSQTPEPAALEIQDLYLADPRLPSCVGKLVQKDWRFYPYLATSLDFIKPGTYSAMTRALVLLAVTAKEELAAFDQFAPDHNPFLLTREQAAVVFFCCADNDAAVVHPLFSQLAGLDRPQFDEREAGELLPAILRAAIAEAQRQVLAPEDRDRVAKLSSVAASIERWKGRRFTGGGPREEAIRPRLEPYCDLGLFTKPEPHRFFYQCTPALRALLAHWRGPADTDDFLANRFFTALAAMHGLTPQPAAPDEARAAFLAAAEFIKSSLGYSPITDLGLLAGLRLLFGQNRLLEIKQADALLLAWQKEAPDAVRFTVDRMGNRAYVKFLKPTPNTANAIPAK
ncbi:MAG: hypothetical protein RMK20_08670 [Verrucomicrobiales bacterium]|nr:hypothetical protein [Verrucomicrobiales bacterium]